MRCSEVMERLEKLAPVSYACSWDNPGLLAGRREKEIHRIVVALDATEDVIGLAVRERADMILTHHPLIFGTISKINDGDFLGARLIKLIQNDICCYAMHTNFDSAPGGMADLAAARLKLQNPAVLESVGVTPDGVAYGIGKAGELPEPMSLEELAAYVKEAFGLPWVSVYGLEQETESVVRIAVCPGSGKHMLSYVKASGAKVLITGDVGHHDGIDAVADGVAVINAGHYGLEHIFIDFMDTYIREKMDGELVVVKAPVRFPESVL